MDKDETVRNVRRILDETQEFPPLEPFKWYDATPENCARIPIDTRDNKTSIFVNVIEKGKILWYKSFYFFTHYRWMDNEKITHFMLIETPK